MPAASSAHASGSSRNAAYMSVWTTSATNAAAIARPRDRRARAAQQQRQRRDEQREVDAPAR